MKKLFSVLFLVFLLTFVLGGFVFSQGRELEVEYPKIGDYEITKTTTSVPEYIRYIYFAVIGISGLIALGILIWAGFRYLTSAGNPEKLKDAKEYIAAAILGLIILFGSWLIVNTINPQLTLLHVAPLETFIPELPAGVYLCNKQEGFKKAWDLYREYDTADFDRRKKIKEELTSIISDITKNCYTKTGIISSDEIPKKIAKKIKYIYLVPYLEGPKVQEYGAIAFEEKYFLGKLRMVIPPHTLGRGEPIPIEPYYELIEDSSSLDQIEGENVISKVSSIVFFSLTPPTIREPGGKVTLYSHPDYNFNLSKDEAVKSGYTEFSYPVAEWSRYIYYYDTIKGHLRDPKTGEWRSPQSIKVEKDIIAVLRKGEESLFTFSSPNLLDYNEVTEKKCDPLWHLLWRECITIPAADGLIIISGKIMW